jgi:hypothetical protein
MLAVPQASIPGERKVTAELVHENPDPVKLMMMRAGNNICWRYWGFGFKKTSTRTEVAETRQGETVTLGKLTPMVEARTASRTPLVPDAITESSELRIADRILKNEG